jgi:hypothetical protein
VQAGVVISKPTTAKLFKCFWRFFVNSIAFIVLIYCGLL